MAGAARLVDCGFNAAHCPATADYSSAASDPARFSRRLPANRIRPRGRGNRDIAPAAAGAKGRPPAMTTGVVILVLWVVAAIIGGVIMLSDTAGPER